MYFLLVSASYTSDQVRTTILFSHKTIFCFQNHQALQSLHTAKDCWMGKHTSFLKDRSPTEADYFFFCILTTSVMRKSMTVWLLKCLFVIGEKKVSKVHEWLTKKEFRWSRTVSSSWGTVKDCWLQNSSRSFADCNQCVSSLDSLWYL